MTHAELVKRAARWLRGMNCHAVVTEMAVNSEVPDAIGWWYGSHSILVECKASRADFHADKEKQFRKLPELGMGYKRFFMAPKGLLTVDDVRGMDALLGGKASGWGLLEVTNKRVQLVLQSEPFLKRNTRAEMRMLVSALRRMQLRINQPLHEVIKWGTVNSPSLELLAAPDSELMYI